MKPRPIEDRFRRLVKRRLPRGPLRQEVAEAAGHTHSSWVTNWLKGTQKAVKLDEIAAIAVKLRIPMQGLFDVPALDPELVDAISDERTAAQIRGFLKLPEKVREELAGPERLSEKTKRGRNVGSIREPKQGGHTKSV